jgi:hypothetical protein
MTAKVEKWVMRTAQEHVPASPCWQVPTSVGSSLCDTRRRELSSDRLVTVAVVVVVVVTVLVKSAAAAAIVVIVVK